MRSEKLRAREPPRMKLFRALLPYLIAAACDAALLLAPKCEVRLQYANRFVTVVDEPFGAPTLDLAPLGSASQTFTVVSLMGNYGFSGGFHGGYISGDAGRLITVPSASSASSFALIEDQSSGGFYLTLAGQNVTMCPDLSCRTNQLGLGGQDPLLFYVEKLSCPDCGGYEWFVGPYPYTKEPVAEAEIALTPDQQQLVICDGCVEAGVNGSVVIGAGHPPTLVVKDTYNGGFAFQAPNGRFLRLCSDCYAGQTGPVLVADGDPSDPAAQFVFRQRSETGLPPSIYRQEDPAAFLVICSGCVPGFPMLGLGLEADGRDLFVDVYSCRAPLRPYCDKRRGYAIRRSANAFESELPTKYQNSEPFLPDEAAFPFRLWNIPDSLSSGSVTQPRAREPLLAGTELAFDCCGDEDCEFYVAVYRCKGCPSDDGGLPLALLAADEPWSSGSCAPEFAHRNWATTAGPFRPEEIHPMRTFHKTVGANETLVLDPLSSDLDVLVIFGQKADANRGDWCSTVVQQGPFPDEAPCAASCYEYPF
ncbi:hypothetical protein DIPPA_14473 [Diplonema papillatum]|nr:hypothetical protein DIPPA_14473 [Diplonema papillatum]